MKFQGLFSSLILFFLVFNGYSWAEPDPAKDAPPSLKGVLTLPQVIAAVLEHSPDLAVYSYDIRAAEARQIQAGLRPNPEISLSIEDISLGNSDKTATHTFTQGAGFGASGLSPAWSWEKVTEKSKGGAFRDAEYTLSLSQLIELGGKRMKRMALAAQDKTIFTWEYEIARADILEKAAEAFVTVLSAQETARLDDELVNLADQVLRTVTARVEAGRVSPLEEKKAATTLESTRLAAETARRTLAAARTQLAALWGEEEAGFDRVDGALDAVRPLPTLESLVQRIAKNPELERWCAEMEKRAAAVDLEKAKGVPDLTVSAGLRVRSASGKAGDEWAVGIDGIQHSASSSGEDTEALLVAEVSLPLPLFNRNQGNIREAEELARKASLERRNAALHIRTALHQAYQESMAATTAITTLNTSVLPSVTDTYNAVNEAYREGKFGFLDVLDAQRTLFETRVQYLDALTMYHLTVARMERLIGESLWPEEEKTAAAVQQEKE